MRSSAVLTAALMAGAVNAAPTTGLISNILGLITNDLNKLLSSLGIKLRTDGGKHGATVPYHQQCPFTIPAVNVSPDRFSHDLTWGNGVNGANFVDWKTFKANGANLGGWLEKEQTHDPVWWSQVGGDGAPDEWTLCQNLGSKCASVFEERYASFLNTSTIDQLATVGVNTLRIPLTYAAFIDVPGSQLHHGNQLNYLKTITNYAITKYNMHSKSSLYHHPKTHTN
jgi:glucan 1,3-beta-glucosidase